MSASGARLALGVVLLVLPGLPTRLTRTPATRGVRGLTRVLGARYAVQGAAGAEGRVGAAVEVLHAASMVPVAVLYRRYARLALLSAAVATGFAVEERNSGR